jgi:hypothetical protein
MRFQFRNGPFKRLKKEEIVPMKIINPEGVTRIDPIRPAPRISTLRDKTIVLRWNGKHNGDHYLNKVAELLVRQETGVKVIKLWEVDPSTARISQSPEESEGIANKTVDLGADLVIGVLAD